MDCELFESHASAHSGFCVFVAVGEGGLHQLRLPGCPEGRLLMLFLPSPRLPGNTAAVSPEDGDSPVTAVAPRLFGADGLSVRCFCLQSR